MDHGSIPHRFSLYGTSVLPDIDSLMENRIDALFSRLQTEGKKAFVAYVAAGDPDLEHCKAVIKGLADAGADLIEGALGCQLIHNSVSQRVRERDAEFD